jgi:hypothetical protein
MIWDESLEVIHQGLLLTILRRENQGKDGRHASWLDKCLEYQIEVLNPAVCYYCPVQYLSREILTVLEKMR